MFVCWGRLLYDYLLERNSDMFAVLHTDFTTASHVLFIRWCFFSPTPTRFLSLWTVSFSFGSLIYRLYAWISEAVSFYLVVIHYRSVQVSSHIILSKDSVASVWTFFFRLSFDDCQQYCKHGLISCFISFSRLHILCRAPVRVKTGYLGFMRHRILNWTLSVLRKQTFLGANIARDLWETNARARPIAKERERERKEGEASEFSCVDVCVLMCV